MRICVIGAGYVGLVSAACFAEMGNRVICVERDAQRVARLAHGQSPIYEPGLEAMLQTHLSSGQLSFSQHLNEGITKAEIIFIAVGTPSGEDGSADLSHVLAVADELGDLLEQNCVVVNKSTVPVGTAERVAQRINSRLSKRGKRFAVTLVNPGGGAAILQANATAVIVNDDAGLAILAMILVNNPGSWQYVYPPLLHAEWHGWTPTDLIFPAFLVMVGMAIPYSLAGRQTLPKAEQIRQGAIRAFKLYLLGLFLVLPVFALAAVVFGLVNGLVASRLLAELPQPSADSAVHGAAGVDSPER